MMNEVLVHFGLPANASIKKFGSGLINHTWLITANNQQYILQSINVQVFTRPEAIDKNVRAIGAYLHKNFPDYLFVQPLAGVHNITLQKT